MEFEVSALNKEGFPVKITGEWPTDYTGLMARLTDDDLGWGPLIVTAPKGLPTQAGGAEAGAEVPENIRCQFNPNHAVKGTPKIPGTNRGPYSAEQVAASRAEKMGKMGKPALPVCGDCWNKGGHKANWDAYYSAHSG